MNWDTIKMANPRTNQADPDLEAWFVTPGDADDFIFYWEEGGCSDK